MLLIYPLSGMAESIPGGYYSIARQYQIPAQILYAAALTESGKTIQTGVFRPWPWTLNVAGTPRRFTSRKRACQALKHHLANGIRSIDIGLMQINWRWHHKRLRTPCLALQPYTNLQHGAALLKAAYAETLSWPAAVGYYHSPGQTLKQRDRAYRHAERFMRHVATFGSF